MQTYQQFLLSLNVSIESPRSDAQTVEKAAKSRLHDRIRSVSGNCRRRTDWGRAKARGMGDRPIGRRAAARCAVGRCPVPERGETRNGDGRVMLDRSLGPDGSIGSGRAPQSLSTPLPIRRRFSRRRRTPRGRRAATRRGRVRPVGGGRRGSRHGRYRLHPGAGATHSDAPDVSPPHRPHYGTSIGRGHSSVRAIRQAGSPTDTTSWNSCNPLGGTARPRARAAVGISEIMISSRISKTPRPRGGRGMAP